MPLSFPTIPFHKTDQKQRLWSLEWVVGNILLMPIVKEEVGVLCASVSFGFCSKCFYYAWRRKKVGRRECRERKYLGSLKSIILFKKPLTCSPLPFGGFLLNEMDEKDSLQDILGFFQFWTRDEAISAKGLCLAGKRETAKRILLGALSRMDDTGRIRTVLHPLISVLRMEWAGYFSTTRGFSCWFLSPHEQEIVRNALQTSLQRLEQHLLHDDLFIMRHSKPGWIRIAKQTREKDIVSKFKHLCWVCILFARTHFRFSKKKKEFTGKRFRERIRKAFERFLLRDEASGNLLRPNLFAAYIVPEILTKTEWKSAFDVALEKLLASLGGVATIEKNHPSLFYVYWRK